MNADERGWRGAQGGVVSVVRDGQAKPQMNTDAHGWAWRAVGRANARLATSKAAVA